jgi:hypothetical protein
MPLKSKYSASDLRSVLTCMLKPQGKRWAEAMPQPFYYTGIDPNTVVLPPVADTKGLGLERFDQTLQAMFEYCQRENLSLDGKKMIFPVVQGQTIFGMPRNHFVTLHYDPATRIATILDSRPRFAGFLYPLEALKKSLRKGLAHAHLVLDEVVVKYQATQWDDTHCGAWTATNSVALSEGLTVEAQEMALSYQDGPRIVQHNIKSVRDRARVPYAPLEAIKANALTPKSSASDLSSDYVDVGEVVGFSDEDKATYILTAQDIFHHCFSSPEALANALIARENITFNGERLNLNNIDTIASNLDEMFSDLEADQTLGYGLFNGRYVTAKLRDVGFEEAAIQAMSLADKLRYDAALCFAEANAGHEIAKALLVECAEEISETMLEDGVSEARMFKVVLATFLKQEVLQQQAAEHSATTAILTASAGSASAALLPELREEEESPVSVADVIRYEVPLPIADAPYLPADAGAGQVLPTKNNNTYTLSADNIPLNLRFSFAGGLYHLAPDLSPFKLMLRAAMINIEVLNQQKLVRNVVVVDSKPAPASVPASIPTPAPDVVASRPQPIASTPVSSEDSGHSQEISSYALSNQLMFGIALTGGVLLLVISLALANPVALGVGAVVTAASSIGLIYGLFSSSEENDNSPSVHTTLSGF